MKGDNAGPDTLGEFDSVNSRAIIEHDHELFTAPANHCVAAAHRLPQDTGNFGQDAVSSGVTKVVVNLLEVINITYDQGKRAATRLGVHVGVAEDLFSIMTVV
ncbi:protein of unknown function [Burkholderia multivorans]